MYKKMLIPLLLVFVMVLTACNDSTQSISQPPEEPDLRASVPSVTPSPPEPNEPVLVSTPDDPQPTENPTDGPTTTPDVTATPDATNPPPTTQEPSPPPAQTAPPATNPPQADAPRADSQAASPPPTNQPTQNPTSPPTPPPASPPPAQTGRQYNMDDPNVKAFPIYVTAKNASELKAGDAGWQSAAEIIAAMKNDDPDYLIDGMTVYDRNMPRGKEWLDNYLTRNGLSLSGKTDFQKTAIIRQIIADGLLEEFIGLWQPGFKFTSGDCLPRAQAVHSLMILMDFKMFKQISCRLTDVLHENNAYWDDTVGAVRFIDADFGWDIWNIYIYELDGKNVRISVF